MKDVNPATSHSEASQRILRVVAVLLILTGLGTAVFWVTFFADYAAQQTGELATRCSGWFLWERSFPLADLWAALACLLGGLGLWRARPTGLLWSLVAGGALVFLGLMDILFFLQNGLYWPMAGEVLLEALIHLWVTGFGLATIAVVWSRRGELGVGRS